MANPTITEGEVAILLELAVASAPAKELELGPRGVWRQDHEEFTRRLATRLTEALRGAGYAWAKLPTHGDFLYTVLVDAISGSGSAYRIGVVSEDPDSRAFARAIIAQHVVRYLRNTETVVVRRSGR